MLARITKKRRKFNMNINEFHNSKQSWVNKEKKSWNIVTFVSYFCIKYENLYEVKYRFSRWAGNPALTKEGRDFSKLLKEYKESGLEMLEAKMKLYNYINWSFDYKGARGTNINSSGLLCHHSFFNEFEKKYSSFMKKKKSKVGIFSLLEWCKDNAPSILDNYDIETDKDLVFIEKMTKMDGMQGSDEYNLILESKKRGML